LKEDEYGNIIPFAIRWSGYVNVAGSDVAKVEGLSAELMKSTI